MTISLLPVPKARFFDASGAPLNGGKVYTYVAGTTTPKTSYTDSTGNTANANPVILDSAGEANIWLNGNYKIILKNSADVTQWTVDNVSAGSQISMQWLTVTGTDTLVATSTEVVTSYSEQQLFLFFAAATNTTAVTLNINGLGAKAITKNGTTPLIAGDIVSGSMVLVVYDGTRFQLASGGAATYLNKANGGTVSGTIIMSGAAINNAAYVDVASASTCDIGAAASNNVRITGTTTITGLGTATAGITRELRFADALTLTYNATSLITPSAASITTAANDTATAISLGSGNWIITAYQRADGSPVYSSGRLIGVQNITSTQTYTPTTGTNFVVVEIWGGGGSGARSNDANPRCGGAGGGYARKKITSSFSGVTVTIGAAGGAVTSDNTAGNNGGTTSFGAIFSATGGAGGVLSNDVFSQSGTGSGGDINANGGRGYSVSGTMVALSVGGAAYGFGTEDISMQGAYAPGGGAGYGSGGAGSKTGVNSGAGAPGLCIIWEYS